MNDPERLATLLFGLSLASRLRTTPAASVTTSSIGGVPPTRSIFTGTGLQGGGDLSIDRTHSLADTAVNPGTYAYSSLTVDQQGRLTSASNGTTPVLPTRNVATGTGLQGGGDLSADRTFSLADTAVTPGIYTNVSLTIDQQGRITLAASGASGPALANPTAQVGLSAVNGSAITAMRSDGAPALDQSIAPTWSGLHTFSLDATFTGSVLTNLLDARTASILSIGPVTATGIGLQQSTTLAAGKSLTWAAGSGGFQASAATGGWTLPQGSGSWGGGVGAGLTLTAGSSGAINITGKANSLWRTSSGDLSISGFSALFLQFAGVTLMDIGTTTPNVVTISVGKSLALDSGTATGNTTSATLSKQVGVVTTGSMSTTALSTTTYTITNSLVTSASKVFATVQNGTNTVGPVVISNPVPGAGSFTIGINNLNAVLALNGTLKIHLQVFG